MRTKTSQKSIFLQILNVPIYFFKYIFLGIKTIIYCLFWCLSNLCKYTLVGLITILYCILSLPFNLFKYLFLGLQRIVLEFQKLGVSLSKKMNSKKYIDGDNILNNNFENQVILKPKSKKQKLKEEKKQKALEVKQLKLEKRQEQQRLKKEKRDLKRQKVLEAKQLKLEKKQEQQRLKKEKLELKKQKALEAKQLKLEKKQEQQRLKKEKLELKKQKDLDAKQLKLEKRKEKRDAKFKKKKKNEAYINDKYSGKKLPKKSFKDIIKSINNLPSKIKKYFQNTLLYRNAKNIKDKDRQILLLDFDGEDAVKSPQKNVYEYVGKNADGKVVKDYFPAFSRVEVHSFLLSEGFEVYSIRTSKLINLLHRGTVMVNTKFRTKDLIFFLTQLSTYIKAGLPLVESLRILSRQFKRKSYQKLFRAMIYDLTMGENFSSAMNKQGKAFPQLLINMIKASEMTGELPEALDDMAEYYTQADKSRKQMITALTYPTIVFTFALGVMVFIMLYVVPKFVDIYKSMDESQIPGFTLFVMNTSYFLQKNIIFILIGLILLLIIVMILYRNVKSFRWAVQWVAMHLPVLKNIIIYNEVQMFTKTFSSLLSHSVFITDTLEILSKITNNEIYKMLVRDTAANLERGEKISAAYKDQWAFPVPAYEMLVTGERTGQLAEMMKKVSLYYQDLYTNSVTRIKSFIEPILIVFLTVVVGFIVLSIVIPMFNMYNQII